MPAQNCSAWSVGAQGCEAEWGVTPRPEWARVALGGKRIHDATNIVFSNGLQDPWHGGGVLRNLSDSVLAILIPNGAHHIDLMFTDPADEHYPDVAWAREFERTQMRRWVKEHRERTAARGSGGGSSEGRGAAAPADLAAALQQTLDGVLAQFQPQQADLVLQLGWTDGKTEIALFPGDLPDDPERLFASGAAPAGAGVRYVRFRPPELQRTAEGMTLSLPHIRLDRALQFLIGDRLA